jgi:hypothetical protein
MSRPRPDLLDYDKPAEIKVIRELADLGRLTMVSAAPANLCLVAFPRKKPRARPRIPGSPLRQHPLIPHSVAYFFEGRSASAVLVRSRTATEKLSRWRRSAKGHFATISILD